MSLASGGGGGGGGAVFFFGGSGDDAGLPTGAVIAGIGIGALVITVQLTKDIENCPSIAYLIPKEQCAVKTVKKVNAPIENYDFLYLNSKTKGLEM